MAGRIRVARIGAVHGVRGEVKLWSFTQDPMAVAHYGPLETEDGALIYIRNWGLRHGPPGVIARLGAGEKVDPGEYYFRTTPVFETGAAEYAWLNCIIAVAVGERRADAVLITVYELK